MNRTTYWLFMMAAALMAGALVALPLWDYYHYRQPTVGGLPASPTWPGASPGARQPAETSPQEKSLPAANQAASIGWIAGGLPSGPPAMPAPLPQSTASNHDGSGQSDGSRASGTAETVPDPQDASSLRLSLAPDRHAVSRGQ